MKRITAIIFCIAGLIVGFAWDAANALPPSARDSASKQGWPLVTGTVSYKERMTLPLSAVIHVELLDVSQKDPRKALLGEDSIWTAGVKLPIGYRIPYDPSRVDPTHIYIVRARITDGEKTIFVSAAITTVLTKGAPNTADIIVVPVMTRY